MTRSFASSSTPTGSSRPPRATATLTVFARTLGCKVNQVESQRIVAELLGQGASLAPEDAAAVIVVNTCTVTGEADKKARKAVRHALALPQHPVVVVTGCLAAVDAPALRALDERVVVEVDKARVAARVAEALGLAPQAAPQARTGEGFNSRVMLKVEDGCNNHCSYCIVPAARGVPRAEPLQGLVAEAEELAGAGVSEIVVTGINVGRYRDQATDSDLAALLEALAATGIARLRLSSVEPPDLDARLLGVMASLPAFCPHLHVPLQSGSDRVLAAMKRAYSAGEFLERVREAKGVLPGLAITTDVIVGFPGESEEDFAETLAVCREAGFSKLHVFRYSRRAGTPAAEMPGQVPPEVMAERSERLRALGDELRTAWLGGLVGSQVEMLVERVLPDGSAEGTTREYARARVQGASSAGVMPGALLACRVTGRDGDVLICSLA